MRDTKGAFPLAVGAFVALTWLGMLIGVSFIATPVKFEVSSLSLPVALEVGRVTFSLFAKIEWSAAALLVIALVPAKTGTALKTMVIATVAILAVEALWLLPVLDARVSAVIAGQPLPPSLSHLLYALSEVAKALLLSGIAALALRKFWLANDTPVMKRDAHEVSEELA